MRASVQTRSVRRPHLAHPGDEAGGAVEVTVAELVRPARPEQVGRPAEVSMRGCVVAEGQLDEPEDVQVLHHEDDVLRAFGLLEALGSFEARFIHATEGCVSQRFDVQRRARLVRVLAQQQAFVGKLDRERPVARPECELGEVEAMDRRTGEVSVPHRLGGERLELLAGGVAVPAVEQQGREVGAW
jgi:hypothetical protein